MADENKRKTLPLSGPGESGTADQDRMIEKSTKRFKIVSLLGEGGFGIVYLAEQKEPVKRQVALKVIKPGMNSKKVIGRFEAERQALAILDHPNIAQVFDGGTTKSGLPYFVMEYVKGLSITEYCDRNKLDTEQRLDLFLDVCRAIQHAHQKGIIHRDIKPSNILVSKQQDKIKLKVIDFGVAKAISQPLTEQRLFTEQGQLLGTPEYMSPEQAERANQDIDIRSDIYSLGVLLYELLTGILPFDPDTLRAVALDEIIRIIREEDPPRPSTRLLNLGEKATTLATNRHTDVKSLSKRLYKELEWIPLKAMRKEPDRRYQTASELAEDVRNYLKGNPLIAGPESATYRARKFIRKRCGIVAAVAIVLLVLIVGIAVSTIFALKAEKALEETNKALTAKTQALERAEKAEKDAREKTKEVEQARVQETRARIKADNAKKAEQKQRKLVEERMEELRFISYVDKIHLADRLLTEGDFANAYFSLIHCPNDLRGWEWFHLLSKYEASGTTIYSHQPHNVIVAALSTNGKRIVTSGAGGLITIVDVGTGTLVTKFKSQTLGMPSSLSLSPNGEQVILANSNKSVFEIWDVERGSLVKTFPGKGVRSVRFSPDGTKFLSRNSRGSGILWDITTGSLKTLTDCIALCFSPDSSKIAGSDSTGTVKIWNTETGFLESTFFSHTQGIESIRFKPDGMEIILCEDNGKIKFWDLTRKTKLREIDLKFPFIADEISLSPNGKYLAATGDFGDIVFWDIEEEKKIKRFHGHRGRVRSLIFTPDSQEILSHDLSRDFRTLRLWRLKQDNPIKEIADSIQESVHQQFPSLVLTSPDARYICCYNSSGQVEIWDIQSKSKYFMPHLERASMIAFAFSADGQYIIIGSSRYPKAQVFIWDISKKIQITSLDISSHISSITAIAFSFDGDNIIVGGRSNRKNPRSVGRVAVFDVKTGAIIRTFESEGNLLPLAQRSIAISPNGERSAICHGKLLLTVWDCRKGIKVWEKIVGLINGFALSQNGKYILTLQHPIARVWDLESGLKLSEFDSGYPDDGTSYRLPVAFNPDGTRVILSFGEKHIGIWDTMRGEKLLDLKVESKLRSVTYSGDGRKIVALCDNGIKIWDSASKERPN